jgi:hypothetical protein
MKWIILDEVVIRPSIQAFTQLVLTAIRYRLEEVNELNLAVPLLDLLGFDLLRKPKRANHCRYVYIVY